MRFDPLILHYLARELEARLTGARAFSVRLDSAAGAAALETSAGTLLLDLHPARGTIGMGAAPAAAVVLSLPARAVVAGVSAPPDERLLLIELAGLPRARPHWLVAELMTNQWNALVLDGTAPGNADLPQGERKSAGGTRPAPAWAPDGRILTVLRPRQAGGRSLRPGAPYSPPAPSPRAGVEAPLDEESWRALLTPVAIEERPSVLVARVAWTSPINARAILGHAAEADDPDALAQAHEHYYLLAARPAPAPCVLETPRGLQPYPLPLPGVRSTGTRSLLDALALAGGVPGPEAPAAPSVEPELLEQAQLRDQLLERRIRRLEAQAAGAARESEALRTQADLLLANLHALRKGMKRVTLPDFAGGELAIELDPALAPADNARRLYERARRRQRAAARVPGLVEALQAQRARLADALARAQAGDTVAAAGELRALTEAPARAQAHAPAERVPYRRYRTSGGLEVRVGRSRRDNDELTFHRSAPEDIWLHARDAGGAHVVLRWGDSRAGPPQRDLAEAAVLAALHSRARTSGTVAVDWTRRKYVRKPRKAPPGLVVPERVKTLFVEPDEEVERRLRA